MAPSFNNIVLGGKANKQKGVLRLNEHGFGWKDPHGKSVTVMRKELKSASAVLVGPSRHKLLLSIGDEREVSFEGLDTKDLSAITKFAKEQLGLEVTSRLPCTKGWNWGSTQFEGKKLQFMVGGQLAFEMPLANVSQCQQLKKEVSLEIHRDEDALTECLTGITLWSPADDYEHAKTLHKTIMSKADMLSTSGGEIVTLPQVQLKVPRGKYDLEIYGSLMRLKGTQSFTLLYDNITRISWMKTTDDRYFYIVLSVHPPLRRGHTHYPHILMQIKDEATMDVEASLSATELKEKFGDKIPKQLSGSMFEVVFNVLRDVTGKRLTRVGKFQSRASLPAVRTSLKANDGYLYPMEKCFFFVPSPPIFIKYSSCTEVEFARVSGASGIGNRTFDLVIFHSSNQTYVFKNIDKEEYEPLYAYLSTKKLTLKSDQQDEISAQDKLQMQMQMLGEDSDEDDDDFGSDDEDAVVISGGEEDDDDDGSDDEEGSDGDDDEEDDEDSDDGAISEDELAALKEDAEDIESYGKGKRKRAASRSPAGRPAKKQKTEN